MEDLEPFLLDDIVYHTRTTRKYRDRKAYAPVDARKIVAAIPGVILQVHVKRGQKVRRGERLLVLEAMKMKNDVVSPRDGEVLDVLAEVGQMVGKGQLLVELS